MLRHIYQDWVHVAKGTRPMATLVTFVVSAVLHEFVMSFAFGIFRPVLSGSMLLQSALPSYPPCSRSTPAVGIIYATRASVFAKHGHLGNAIMWMTVFIGQPFVSISYCFALNHAYMLGY